MKVSKETDAPSKPGMTASGASVAYAVTSVRCRSDLAMPDFSVCEQFTVPPFKQHSLSCVAGVFPLSAHPSV